MVATTGVQNTSVGVFSMGTLTTSNSNTAVGYYSQAWSTGSDNVSLGHEALRGAASNALATGGRNVAIGRGSMEDSNGNGYRNTAVGYQTLRSGTTCYENTCLGYTSGDNLTTGARNVTIGASADTSANNVNYEIVIGYNIVGKGESTGFISPGGGSVYQGNNSSTWNTISDIRIKKNVVDNNTGLDKINQIRVRNFEYRKPEEVDSSLPSNLAVDKEGLQLGVIAQEIETILPDVVNTESTGCKSVNSDNITWYLVNAVKELSAKNDALETAIKNAGISTS